MTGRSADAEGVEVHIIYEPSPSPAQRAAWGALWRRLLAPDTDTTPPAGQTEERPAT